MTEIKIYRTEFDVAEALAIELYSCINKTTAENRPASIVLSGGNTPQTLFSVIAENFSSEIDWRYVDIFWGDERCVPPWYKLSNYGMVRRELLDKIYIPPSNIHRIRGEVDPAKEKEWYSGTIRNIVKTSDGLPSFDFIILGIGEDGHTASIFPDNIKLFKSDNICEVVHNPQSRVPRITLTGSVINNAETVVFLATGKNKAATIADIINKKRDAKTLPAAYINPKSGNLKWFLDKEAASHLKNSKTGKFSKYKVIDKSDIII